MPKVTDRFQVGCNYWASHAGTRMWRDWRIDVVRDDLRQMASASLNTLRVFPLWSDFQPIEQLRAYLGEPREIRIHDRPVLTASGLEAAGIDPVMFDRFRALADVARECELSLIVGLVTGWMSGRFFAPPALAHFNAITNAESIRWQVRFVREFVRAFRSHDAILAWGLGNECNCMGAAASSHEASAWTHAIASTVRSEDPTRQVVSGMHGLSVGSKGPWTIADQGELTDIVTTHPYPLFTPGCDLDPINSFRPALHASAESCLYADLGGRPCLVEEIGTLGDEIASEATVADYVRMSLHSSWAHGHCGFLWWCGYDQLHLAHAPYDWNAVERELGLFRGDRTPKPVLGELTAFARLLGSMPSPGLPPRLLDAVCLLTHDQDHWRIAYATFLLAKQAGLDIRFHDADRPLPDSSIYFMPCYSGLAPIGRAALHGLLERVRAGATLYLSHNDGVISHFRDLTGLEVVTRARAGGSVTTMLPGGSSRLTLSQGVRQTLRPVGAEVLAADGEGNPVLSRFRLGKGEVFYLAAPVEWQAATTPGFFDAGRNEAWRIYSLAAERNRQERAMPGTPDVGVTEHPLADGMRLVVQINYRSKPAKRIEPVSPWRIVGSITPPGDELAPYSAAVFQVAGRGPGHL
jgi:hypothetical protein